MDWSWLGLELGLDTRAPTCTGDPLTSAGAATELQEARWLHSPCRGTLAAQLPASLPVRTILMSGCKASLSAFWRRCAAALCEDGCGPKDIALVGEVGARPPLVENSGPRRCKYLVNIAKVKDRLVAGHRRAMARD